MATKLIMINGKPFKCDCGCMAFKKVPISKLEPKKDGDYYKCKECGAVYKKE